MILTTEDTEEAQRATENLCDLCVFSVSSVVKS
jgi:hypothetical protein